MLWLRGRLVRIERRNLIVATLSVAVTSIVITGFLIESKWGYSKPSPLLIYVESWKADRSRAEAKAQQQKELAELRRKAAAQQAAEKPGQGRP